MLTASAYGQTNEKSELPYRQIPDYPEKYSTGNVLGRMIDGLGYRFYWATEGLQEKDLAFSPSTDARNTLQTIEHIYQLSVMVLNASEKKPNLRPANWPEMDFVQLRQATLQNLQTASELLKKMKEKEIAKLSASFKRDEKVSSFPYWHIINGPIADAIYHTGQVVSFRRMSGNPIHPKVNVFMGKTAE